MKQISLLFSLTAFCLQLFSQNTGTIRGVVFDTLKNEAIPGATITLMNKKDSSLVTFTMGDSKGSFQLNGLNNGDYRMLISHVNYHNTSKIFSIDNEHKIIDLSNIIMVDKNKVLSEVLVTAESAPVMLLDDTIQYNAGSFKTLPNANVEDLLKKLPGVKVEKDGTVKAQGEKVQKVLVDGKEFFGNDPKIATKNLPADAIDKVQVYDKLSDQAQMTGFDDGNSEKTINLKLKKDKKKGGFGKVSAGSGTGQRYQGRFNINSFKGARQFSVLGMANNTNTEGFSFMDVLSFTGALNQLKNGGGNIDLTISRDDPLAALLGGTNSGINTTWAGGINFNDIVGSKTDFQGNYFYSRYNPNRKTTTKRQYFAPANLYNQTAYTDNLNNSHRLNFNADYQIDSFHSIKISSNINYQQTHNTESSLYRTLSGNGDSLNDGNSANAANAEGNTISTNILFRKKFHKKGRTFSVNILSNLDHSNGNGYTNSLTNFYTPGNTISSDTINQANKNAASLYGVNLRWVYTEPVFKRSLLEFTLATSYTKNSNNKITFDYNLNNGKFDRLNDLLTNNYENVYKYTTSGIRLRRQSKLFSFAAGANLQSALIAGKVISGVKDSFITRNFLNVLPNARFQYNFSRFKNIMVNYSTATNQPTISQLQPIPDNTNPLYIKLGNPNLKQEYTHTVRLNASLVDPFKNRNFFVFLSFAETKNKIVNYDKIDNRGIDSVLPVNVNGVYNLNGNLSYGFPVHFLKGSIDISSGIFRYHGNQFVNEITNTINTTTVGPEIKLDMNPTEKINISLGASLTYSNTSYSVKTLPRAKYLTQEYSTEAGIQAGKGFFFSTDLTYRVNNQYSTGFSSKIPLWNTVLSKQVLRFNRGELKFSANDILNRNTSLSRNASQNFIEDSRVNSLRRYFLLSFSYNLTKTGIDNGSNRGGIKMISR
ncbi:MAG: outer membrane beta-barrel protein [Ginsengibacter sp.]